MSNSLHWKVGRHTVTNTELTGVLVALVTPFTGDGSEIDAGALEAHIDRMINAGIHGLVPGGSTGEFTTLTLEERKQLTELTVKAAGGRVPVVAGTGALSTKDAIDLAAHAAEVGASALMVVPPFYDAPDLGTLKELLGEIYAASGLTIMYYNIPSATGLRLTPAEIASLAEVEGVRYLKDTSGDAVALTELLQLHRDTITAFNGWDTLTFYGIAAGAKGSVWGRRTSSRSCRANSGTPWPWTVTWPVAASCGPRSTRSAVCSSSTTTPPRSRPAWS
jgi:dihydrodipicolinate synthase/N-acetylneuraminate lyase